ncbi:hypothetical protein DTO164E3_3793 [Paecilomyces variotii]|nr:hypothetical protein DTO164E3_3793 [Paecilomyces variotii]KAJ9206097.1 hypothetical protein DTO032I3_1962 [Paecilomyces variotii]KAJ9281700.1 hypothetical protein DTO021D3_1466 [Paecilomyces variotii]KAJ9345962.1 hypothetical protein DTO027B6_1376 [Paecilomyces variotii]KAJ9392341.1 hypothetical protein DTO032I4_755 [Paecilomyces variotii]
MKLESESPILPVSQALGLGDPALHSEESSHLVKIESGLMSASVLQDGQSSSSASPFSVSTPSQTQSQNNINVLGNETERQSLLDNLDNYIPIGVLRRDNGSAPGDDGFPETELASLEKHNWIRTTTHTFNDETDGYYIRVYVLPDDSGRRFVPRSSTGLRRALKTVISRVDSSSDAWEGRVSKNETKRPDSAEDESLWYIFNTLQDPSPDVGYVRDQYSRRAMEDLLSTTDPLDGQPYGYSHVVGLKTPLHPYQRRSAATMVQREAQPAQTLDPRLQAYKCPTGGEYYYDKEEGSIVREKRLYSEACGGILAESMGCGKTLICLSVILATRGHVPRIPTEYQETTNPVRPKVGSLMEMAAASAGRNSLPWSAHFDLLRENGVFYERCVKACEAKRGAYTIPAPISKYGNRGSATYTRPPPTRLTLCSGTLIVVPPNLVDHWVHEIATHTEGLKVLTIRTGADKTPPADKLLNYDIILCSRPRFEREAGEAVNNRRAPAKVEYKSPLKALHWLRIIVDEGHNVAGHGQKNNMMHILDQLHIERRWVVSGTPSTGLYGVEISLASQESLTSDTDQIDGDNATAAALKSRKKTGNAVQEELKDVDKLRLIVVDFLKLKPWSNSRGDDPASWTKYIKPVGEDGKRKKAPSLRAVLQSLVVRHRLDVISDELPLPRLYNKVTYLEPTFYDKLSINLFLFSLTVNIVTSERRDLDYMFHPRNRKHLSQLISNLRQAGFWWTGFEKKDIEATLETALKYMEKNSEKVSAEDANTLNKGIEIARKALSCKSWNAFSNMDELGIFVQDFPEHARGMWALAESEKEPLLLGISQARLAQKFVSSRLTAPDPGEGLAGAGIRARREISDRTGKTNSSEQKSSNSADKLIHKSKPDQKQSPKKTYSKGLFKALPPESPLAKTRLVGTTSAKLTYLLDRVLELHKTEKIIIFYDNNNTAFWIAEGLEVLGIEFRIYAGTLKTSQRTAYLSLFDESEEVRVLVMDLRQASHGLHIASASRVFIVNPIWRPNVESQAIKRAHRIGQTRPVFVETLVLKDTLEDKMLKRRKEMSNAELQQAEKDLLDDSTMSYIIENERFISMSEEELAAQAAYLQNPQGFFDRHKLPLPDNYILDTHDLDQPDPATPSKRKRSLGSANSSRINFDMSPEAEVSGGDHKRKKASSLEFAPENESVMTSGPTYKARVSLSASFGGVAGASDASERVGVVPSLFGDGNPSLHNPPRVSFGNVTPTP